MKILIVDDEKEIASLFHDYLSMDGQHEVSVAYSGSDALMIIGRQKPDLIILDILMPDLTGFQILGMLKKNSETENIPVILSSVTDGPIQDEKKQLGIVDFLRKPVDFLKLKHIVENLGCARPQSHHFSVLLIEDNEEDMELIETGLQSFGCSILKATDGSAGIKLASEKNPDLIILDNLLPSKNGIDVVKELKSSEKTCRIPIILISAYLPTNVSHEKVFCLKNESNQNQTDSISVKELGERIKKMLKEAEGKTI